MCSRVNASVGDPVRIDRIQKTLELQEKLKLSETVGCSALLVLYQIANAYRVF